MAGETVITVVGNLVADPELRATPSGVMVAKFTVAATARRLDKQSGEWQDVDSVFWNMTAWRELGEHIAESLAKGDRVVVQGRTKQDNWEDKESGAKRSRIVIDVDEIGPSLRYATAKVTKTTSGGARPAATTEPGGDPWATASPGRASGFGSQGGGGSKSFDDEPPF